MTAKLTKPGRAMLCMVCCALLASGCRTASAPPSAPVVVAPETCVCGDDVELLLAYQHTVRQMNAAALNRALAGLNRQGASARIGVQKAMLLAALRSAGDLARAQVLLDQVLSLPAADAQCLKPLAALLNAYYGEWRRLDENAERLTQQLHDEQRRADQLSDKLEALKNIERALQAQPGNAAAPGAATDSGGVKENKEQQ